MTEKQSSPVGIGIITIFTVLLVLCLTIFSTLTLASARADKSLSQINADTVTAYYAADQLAMSMATAFADGTEPALEATLPLSDTQSLYLHLLRLPDGSIQVLAWQTVITGELGEVDLGGDGLPVWDGSLPTN